jgi:transposase-like protein
MTKDQYKLYPDKLMQEALVTEQNYSVVEAAVSLGITYNLLFNWVSKVKKYSE